MDVEDLIWPHGIAAQTMAAGLREGGDDISVVVAPPGTTSAAVFTRSRFAGPSVTLSRRHLAAAPARAVVTVAKNANVATGSQGTEHAAELARLVAGRLGLTAEQVLVASTGVIGRPYPMPRLRSALAALAPDALSAGPADVARAMMTTDTVPKGASVALPGGAHIVGVAKGVGMMEPDMATMLVWLTTDAALGAAALDRSLRQAVASTFNSLSIDTDTSTSDSCALLASGAAGGVDEAAFTAALTEVCLDLTRQLARDGEGAEKLLVVRVTGARDDAQAKRIAKAVVNSPLVKTAVHGADPNWGRVVMAVGKCSDETDVEPQRVRVRFGELGVYPEVAAAPAELTRLRDIMGADEVEIGVELGIADGDWTVYGCDLTCGYVRVNADYTT